MNYAIDRSDRKARFSNQINKECSSNIGESTLSLDLDRAHTVIRKNSLLSCHQNQENDVSKEATNLSSTYGQAHALAARTLRDGGFSSQALFHFGMAWMFEPDNPMAAGEIIQG